MMKPCATKGCPQIVDRGVSYCAEHAPPPWQGWELRRQAPGWRKVRSRVMQRDRYECQFDVSGAGLICGARATEVDHIVPRGEGGTDELTNLMAICHEHHLAKTQEEANRGKARR